MFYRLYTLIIKEMQSLLRDPQTRAIMVLPVILQVLLFPYAATLEVTNATIAVYSEDNGRNSIELTQRFAKSKAFSQILLLHSPQEIKATIDNHQALLLIRFPSNFSRDIASGKNGMLQLILDGRNSNSAQIAANYVQQIIQDYQNELVGQRLSNTQRLSNDSGLVMRNWYNPNLDYKWFVVPSLIAMVTTLGVLTVTSLSVTREREQGTLEQLLVSPLTTWQLFIGKAIPSLIVAIFQASIVLFIGIFMFKIPFAGSLPLLYGTMLIYGLSLVGVGLLISAFCATQQQAFIGVFAFIMPAILLSGYVSPVENMPQWLQQITWFNPIRHFTDIAKQIYLKDANLTILWHSLWPMLVFTAVTGSTAYVMFQRKFGE